LARMTTWAFRSASVSSMRRSLFGSQSVAPLKRTLALPAAASKVVSVRKTRLTRRTLGPMVATSIAWPFRIGTRMEMAPEIGKKICPASDPASQTTAPSRKSLCRRSLPSNRAVSPDKADSSELGVLSSVAMAPNRCGDCPMVADAWRIRPQLGVSNPAPFSGESRVLAQL